MKNRTMSIIVLSLFVLLASSAAAVQVSIFGPTEYLRTTGEPTVYAGDFDATAGTGRLIVTNGDFTGTGRIDNVVTSATIYLNSQLIFGPNNFKQSVPRLEAPVNLSGSNRTEVVLNGKPGSHLSVEVTREVTTEMDSDGDGTPDSLDGCPSDPHKTTSGICGCGVADTDTDGDGTPDCNDGCPTDQAKTAHGTCGCDVAETDNDGTPDCNDVCPTDPANAQHKGQFFILETLPVKNKERPLLFLL